MNNIYNLYLKNISYKRFQLGSVCTMCIWLSNFGTCLIWAIGTCFIVRAKIHIVHKLPKAIDVLCVLGSWFRVPRLVLRTEVGVPLVKVFGKGIGEGICEGICEGYGYL